MKSFRNMLCTVFGALVGVILFAIIVTPFVNHTLAQDANMRKDEMSFASAKAFADANDPGLVPAGKVMDEYEKCKALPPVLSLKPRETTDVVIAANSPTVQEIAAKTAKSNDKGWLLDLISSIFRPTTSSERTVTITVPR